MLKVKMVVLLGICLSAENTRARSEGDEPKILEEHDKRLAPTVLNSIASID